MARLLWLTTGRARLRLRDTGDEERDVDISKTYFANEEWRQRKKGNPVFAGAQISGEMSREGEGTKKTKRNRDLRSTLATVAPLRKGGYRVFKRSHTQKPVMMDVIIARGQCWAMRLSTRTGNS